MSFDLAHQDAPTRRRPARVAPNQATATPQHDAWQHDSSLQYWLARTGGGIAERDPLLTERLHTIGRQVGSHATQELADRANRIRPLLHTYDRSGNRIDDVEFDPAWHELLAAVLGSGVTGMPWLRDEAGYVARAAAVEMWSRLDMGVLCPVSMTTAAIPVLRATQGIDSRWAQRLMGGVGGAGDGGDGANNGQATAGMAMTEPQGGSDLAGSSTLAVQQDDGSHLLSGHKWFCSHPVADVLLVLAREPDLAEGSRGLSCFLVPGWLEDGARNRIELQRMKDKLGTWSLASAEVQFREAHATRLGDPGAGVRTIIDMVTHTRMDCAIGSTGIMTRALLEAISHTRSRSAFGATLFEQPLMRMVLADLAIEREGALALAMEVARLFDTREPLARLVPAIAKYWITRRAVAVAIEVVEVLGGNGYTEEFVPARLYRDAQVNSTWEGSGNVIVLDVFRALGQENGLLAALHERVAELLADVDGALAERIMDALATEGASGQQDGRRLVGRLAVVLEAALLASRAADTRDDGDLAVARAFVDTRISAVGERLFGDGGSSLAAAADVLLPRYSLD